MPKHRPVIACQRKGRCVVNMPSPGVIHHLGPHLDQATDQPFHRTPDFFTEQVKRAYHVKKIVGQDTHLQTCMVGVKTAAAGLVPAQSVLALLYPVLYFPAFIVDFHDLFASKPGVGYDKTDSWKKFSRMPFNLADHPARPAPALRPVLKINNPDLNTTLGRSPHRMGEAGIIKAIDADTRNGTRWQLASDHALYADWFKKKGDIQEAKEQLTKAIDLFRECGADGWVTRTEKSLSELK